MNKALVQNLRALSLALKTDNWPAIIPYCTWLMNSQLSPLTNLSPSEMFLGKPAWKMELVPEPNTSPQTHEWIMHQILAQEAASKRLEKLRTTTLKFANKKRIPSSFKENDFVLVHNRRWPQRRWPKLSSPWQGPFKVLKAKFNSLQIMASPSLGGVIDVPLEMCKKWELEMSEEIFSDPDFVFEDFETAPQPKNEVQTMDVDEQAELGYFNVFKIVKHKFQQGWKFLCLVGKFPCFSVYMGTHLKFCSPQ